jgi:signal transduction histidine kinase
MRIKVLIVFVIIYILSAFSWLTFSLYNNTNTDYALKFNLLKAGLNACILQVIQNAEDQQLGKDSTYNYYLKQMQLDVNPAMLQEFVKEEFKGNYVVFFQEINNTDKIIEIKINPDTLRSLQFNRTRQQNIWIYQSLLLLLLVGLGIYGVYYSIDNIYKLNKRQNNFLLSVTHEFKTPIAAIRLMLQTSKNPKINEEKKTELIDKSIENTFRLEDLTENMLAATRVGNKNYQLTFTVIDFTEMIKQVARSQKHNGELLADITEGILVKGDELMVKMAVNNLVSNAYKYSNGQPVKLKLFKKGKYVQLWVEDQGIGVPKTERKNIFKKFYRVQNEETRETKGTGLGLFIVKQTATRHGGSISYRENKPTGSVFILSFPIWES